MRKDHEEEGGGRQVSEIPRFRDVLDSETCEIPRRAREKEERETRLTGYLNINTIPSHDLTRAINPKWPNASPSGPVYKATRNTTRCERASEGRDV